MPRTRVIGIDALGGYALLQNQDASPPQDDYIVRNLPADYSAELPYDSITIWGSGVISFGPPTAAQIAFMAGLTGTTDISGFPGDFVAVGFFDGSYSTMELLENNNWRTGPWVRTSGGVIDFSSEGILLTPTGTGQTGANLDGNPYASGGGMIFWSDLDVTNGTGAGETINGSGLAETLNGLGGDDVLFGLDGADALNGGAGNDRLVGGDGIDRLWGGDGDDVLEPGLEYRLVDGGAGNDRLVLDYSGSAKSVVLDASALLSGPNITGVEAVTITGSQFVDVLSGGSSDDRLLGGAGYDVLRGGAGNDWLDAGPTGISAIGVAPDGGATRLDPVSIDYLFKGTAGYPTIKVDVANLPLLIDPDDGTEYFSFYAEPGSELWVSNVLYSIYGSSGSYHYAVFDANGIEITHAGGMDPDVPYVLAAGGVYTFELSVISGTPWEPANLSVDLSLQSATMASANSLYGGTGDDTYVVNSTSDRVVEFSGEGTDTVRSSVSNTLGVNVENLVLTGNSAINGTGNGVANAISGNGAANVLTGGGGGDTLNGGTGADRFVYTALSDSASGARDLITDFSGDFLWSVGRGKPTLALGQGDVIDLSAIDANVFAGGDQAFTLVKKFSGIAGQAYSSFDKMSGLTSLFFDVNGDKVADMTILLSGNVTLVASDFIL